MLLSCPTAHWSNFKFSYKTFFPPDAPMITLVRPYPFLRKTLEWSVLYATVSDACRLALSTLMPGKMASYAKSDLEL